MESLEQLHKQLNSLNELHTNAKTKKGLSAANIRQYEQAVIALDGNYQTIEQGLHVVLKDMQPPSASIQHTHETPRLAAIVFGLCRRFNEDITTYALNRMNSTATDPAIR